MDGLTRDFLMAKAKSGVAGRRARIWRPRRLGLGFSGFHRPRQPHGWPCQLGPPSLRHEAMPGPEAPIVIKRYANWRLYNTRTAAYVSPEHLARMARQGQYFVVRDSRSGQDITG